MEAHLQNLKSQLQEPSFAKEQTNQNRHEMTTNEHDIKEGRNANSGLASFWPTMVNSSTVFKFSFSAGQTVLIPEFPNERKASDR